LLKLKESINVYMHMYIHKYWKQVICCYNNGTQ